eukprot:CAMPEP_0177597216 /NCGR_PEP_ID=MMETSP0419_2-20121207/11580_1 /TAXON_ID=582737 /ORGANISM="Tetraselmis sp., Strain GSL018" /LENGTH=628 /DNA_ID=CAMNT_0019089345 /DNA_START=504 /DNA_END=2390 /DNA_ORIENTATION=+
MQHGRYLCGTSDKYQRRASHWTTAASRGVFAECAASVAYGHNLLVTWISLLLLVDTISKLVAHFSDLGGVTSPEEDEYVSSTCGGGASLCRAGWEATFFFPWITAGQQFMMLLMILSTPIRFWSPVTLRAASLTKRRRLCRFLRHAVPLSLISLVWNLETIFASMLWIGTFDASKEALQAYLFTSFGNFLFQLLALAWCCGVGAAQAGAVHPAGSLRGQASWIGSSARDLLRARPALLSVTGIRRLAAGLWRRLLPDDEAGKWHWRDVFAAMSILVWANADVTTGVEEAGIAGMWLIRLVFLPLAAAFPDRTASFADLERQSAGFGLLVDAAQLRAAALSALRGEARTRPLPTYKASMLRMREALAVSYRWQPSSVCIALGLPLNMSAWQIGALAEAIQRHGVPYVWIDALSVPQTGHSRLKSTLLSRMMAVYASAGATLVLRSAEADGHRYHQRGWTLQEFCSASSLLVRDEDPPEPPGPEPGPRRSVADSEDVEMRELRGWCAERMSMCRPLWICGGTANTSEGVGDLEAAYQKLVDVSGRVRTKYPRDMLRALYPLMMNTPVEDQDELISLVKQVTGTLGVHEPLLEGLQSLTESDARHTSPPSLPGGHRYADDSNYIGLHASGN